MDLDKYVPIAQRVKARRAAGQKLTEVEEAFLWLFIENRALQRQLMALIEQEEKPIHIRLGSAQGVACSP